MLMAYVRSYYEGEFDMYRYELAQLGVGTRIRIIAQYQHKAYGRLLLLNVSLLDCYKENGADIHESISENEYYEIPEYLTDHVHMDISGTDDKRVNQYIESGDILICTCEIYPYQYSNKMWYDEDTNYAIKKPTDIILIKPFVYSGRIVFLRQPPKNRIAYWYYVGSGSRKCINSDWWNFTQLKELACKHYYEREDFFSGEKEIIHYNGYEIVNETETYLELFYEEHDSHITVYKTICDCIESYSE